MCDIRIVADGLGNQIHLTLLEILSHILHFDWILTSPSFSQAFLLSSTVFRHVFIGPSFEFVRLALILSAFLSALSLYVLNTSIDHFQPLSADPSFLLSIASALQP